MRDKKQSAQQQAGGDERRAPSGARLALWAFTPWALGIERHGQAQPGEQAGVEERDSQRRPVEEELAGHSAFHSTQRPVSSITRATPSASQVIRRRVRAMSAARVRMTPA